MPAEIEGFASYREDAWHQLGTVVDEKMSARQALEFAHMTGWNVRKTPLTTNVLLPGKAAKQVEVAVPDQYAIVRDNPFTKGQVDVFGVVGKQYTPVQNEDYADLLDTIVAESGAHFETVGSLKGGTEVFMTMKLPNTMQVGGVDPVDLYIAALNTHHGNKSFQWIITPVRIVCKNTQTAAVAAATGSFTKRHTRNALDGIVVAVRENLELTYKWADEFQREAEELINQAYTDRQFKLLTEKLFPVKDSASDLVKGRVEAVRGDLMTLWKESPTATEIRGTRWGAYQAVTEYLDHFAPAKGKAGEALAEYRAVSAIEKSDALDRKRFALAYLTK